MKQNLIQISVYGVLLVNLAIGMMMIFSTYTFILILVDLFNQAGIFQQLNLGVFSGIQQVASIVGIILLAGGALAVFPLIEQYYIRSIEKGEYLKHVLQIAGIQLFYWGLIEIIIRLTADVRISSLIWLLLLFGIGLMMTAKWISQTQHHRSEIPIK